MRPALGAAPRLPAFLSPEPGQPGRWKLSWQKTVDLAALRVGVLPVTCHSPLPSLGETLEQRFGETLSPFIRLCGSAPRAPSSRAQRRPWEMANACLTAEARDAPFASAAPAPAMAQNTHSYWPRKPGRIPWAACATGTTTPSHPHRPSEGCTRRGSAPLSRDRAPRARPFEAVRARPRGRGDGGEALSGQTPALYLSGRSGCRPPGWGGGPSRLII